MRTDKPNSHRSGKEHYQHDCPIVVALDVEYITVVAHKVSRRKIGFQVCMRLPLRIGQFTAPTL